MDGRVVDIPWQTGAGNITVETATGGAQFSSDTVNSHLARSRPVTFRTLRDNVRVVRTVRQAGRRLVLRDSEGRALRDKSQALLTVLKDG